MQSLLKMMDSCKRKGGRGTLEATVGLSCLPRINSHLTLRDSAPSPTRTSTHRPTTGQGGASRHQDEDGSLLAQAQVSGGRQIHQSHQGGEEMTRVSSEQPGLIQKEEYGAEDWVWVTPEPPRSGVLGGWKVHASVINSPMCHGGFY